MEMIAVDSSNIRKIGWEGQTLRVEFFNAAYEYYGVSREVFDALMDAASKGRYLNENIKGIYEFRKVG